MTTNLLSVIEQLVGALDDATTSLETISRLAGKTHYVSDDGERVETYMEHHDQVRGYAISRASAARAALSRAQAAPALKATIAQPEQASGAHTFGTKRRGPLEGWIGHHTPPANGQQVETLFCWGYENWAIHLGTAQYKELVRGRGGFYGAETGRPQDAPSYWRPLEGEEAPAVGVPDADLQARCKEILSWQRTGILPDGALRTYAGSKDYSERHDCLQIAEAATAKEAFEYIASAQPQQKKG